MVCCSYDLRVCDYACELIQQGLAPRLVLTGGSGRWTRHLWSVPEARVFAERARAQGIDPQQMDLEEQAANFGQNIAFVRDAFPQLRRVTFVTKPNAVLRVALSVPVQWPQVTAWIDAPPLCFPQQVSPIIGVLGVIHEMVGDIDRVMQYPALGFQIPHALPAPILSSWEYLLAAGFDAERLPQASTPSGSGRRA